MVNDNLEITEDYCDFELSCLFRDAGFNIPCNRYYTSDGKLLFRKSPKSNEDIAKWSGLVPGAIVTCPTHQIAMKWLRVVHKIDINIDHIRKGDWWVTEGYPYRVTWSDGEKEMVYHGKEPKFEVAAYSAMDYALKHILGVNGEK